MNELTIKSANKLGDPHEKYGQSWWGYAEEIGLPIMFNLISDEVNPADKIAYEESETKDGKKGKFMRLKKTKVVGRGQQSKTQEKIADNDLMKMVREIHAAVVVGTQEDDDEEVVLGDIPF